MQQKHFLFNFSTYLNDQRQSRPPSVLIACQEHRIFKVFISFFCNIYYQTCQTHFILGKKLLDSEYFSIDLPFNNLNFKCDSQVIYIETKILFYWILETPDTLDHCHVQDSRIRVILNSATFLINLLKQQAPNSQLTLILLFNFVVILSFSQPMFRQFIFESALGK